MEFISGCCRLKTLKIVPSLCCCVCEVVDVWCQGDYENSMWPCVFVHIHANMHIRSAQVYMKCSPIIAVESREVTEGRERRRLPVVVYSLLSSSATCLSTAFSPAFSSSVSQH